MYGVLEEFIKYRLNEGDTVSVIEAEIKKYLNTKRVNVSDNRRIPVYKEYKDGKKHWGEVTGTDIRFTKEWSDNEPNNTFAKFRNGVNTNHPNFQIKKLA